MTNKTVNGVMFQQVTPVLTLPKGINPHSKNVYTKKRETVHSTYAESDMRVIYHTDKTGEKQLKKIKSLVFVGSGKWVKIAP